MKVYRFAELDETALGQLVQRATGRSAGVQQTVEGIIARVRQEGDRALMEYARQFDRVNLTSLVIEKQELQNIAGGVSTTQRAALDLAYRNIERFHRSQLHTEGKTETMPGVTCWRESRPIEKVGLYIPGGSAVLPSTLLMLGIPARIAGCRELVVCSPPQPDGKVNEFIAYVCCLLGIEKIYLTGGAQAVAAMAYGTESVPKVDKIFGPGNQYVTMAKMSVQATAGTAIDMPAGPSEVLIIADDTAVPAYLAADLLAQAEHGTDSQSILVSTSAEVAGKTRDELDRQLHELPRGAIAKTALHNSFILLTEDMEQAMAFSNRYAPEHLILATASWSLLTPAISNAGSVFLGNFSPESVGDYASGTNHTLPTNGFARAYSGVSVDSFVKKITFQHLTAEGIGQIGPAVEVLATLEGLAGHRQAVSLRLPGAAHTAKNGTNKAGNEEGSANA